MQLNKTESVEENVVDNDTVYEQDLIQEDTFVSKKEFHKHKKEEKKAKKLEKRLKKQEIKSNVQKKRRRRFGDRRDGRLIRSMSPMSKVVPYIMKVRSDAQNHFEDEVDITNIEKYLDEKHEQGYKNVSLLHVLIASYVRCIAQRPGINRFCSGQKIYARNNIECVMTIKKEMSVSSPDTTIKVEFEPTDTVLDICKKFNATVDEALAAESSFDNTARVLSHIPGLFFRFTIGFLRFLDYFGLLPQKLKKVSPFHGSFIITSMGSLGINAIYHHLYDFGNLPVFLSYGKKFSRNVIMSDGSIQKRNFITFKAVTDERICDGYYYASAFKIINRQLQHPEWLDVPPKEIEEDID